MLDERKPLIAERALLVGLYAADEPDPDELLDELEGLVEAAGASVVGRTFQRRGRKTARTDPATFVGRGKAEHVAQLAEDLEAHVVVIDNDLTPAQLRELEKIIDRKIIDRSELILDIFASRARTKQSKLQVELAQLQYTAPRLRGMWTHLSRQVFGGGIGTRGPGEKQIEIDRRIVNDRITRLRGELATIHKRKQREVSERAGRGFCVSLVGYTNAGKSTLLNALTDANVYSADQLFATLETKTRRWEVEPGVWVMLSDTVGFIRRLPHHLVESFRSTLEEALHADLLLHVIDTSHPQATEQIAAVERVLTSLGGDLGDVLCVLNKADQVDGPETMATVWANLRDAVVVSAQTGEGLDGLRRAVAARRRAGWMRVRVRVPAGEGKFISVVRQGARVLNEDYDHDIWVADLELPKRLRHQLVDMSSRAEFVEL